MTKLIKRKGLLFLMAIAVMVAMMSVACKNKSTGVSLSVEEPAVANVSEELTPDAELSIDKNKGLLQYDGRYFESKTYRNEDGITFKYAIEIKNLNDQFNNTILTFIGYENGKQFSRKYYQMGFKMGSGDIYDSASSYDDNYDRRLKSSDNGQKASVRFYNDENGGWADLKPSDYNFTIKLALKNK